MFTKVKSPFMPLFPSSTCCHLPFPLVIPILLSVYEGWFFCVFLLNYSNYFTQSLNSPPLWKLPVCFLYNNAFSNTHKVLDHFSKFLTCYTNHSNPGCTVKSHRKLFKSTKYCTPPQRCLFSWSIRGLGIGSFFFTLPQ